MYKKIVLLSCLIALSTHSQAELIPVPKCDIETNKWVVPSGWSIYYGKEVTCRNVKIDRTKMHAGLQVSPGNSFILASFRIQNSKSAGPSEVGITSMLNFMPAPSSQWQEGKKNGVYVCPSDDEREYTSVENCQIIKADK